MAVTKILARGWTFSINTGDDVTPVWTPVKGITSFTPTQQKNDADTTDFDDQGAMAHIVASRGLQFACEGFHLEDPATGERDPGQEAVEALADAIDADSLGSFQLESPGGNIWQFLASAQVNAPGGGVDDAAQWNVTLTSSGTITKIPAS